MSTKIAMIGETTSKFLLVGVFIPSMSSFLLEPLKSVELRRLAQALGVTSDIIQGDYSPLWNARFFFSSRVFPIKNGLIL